MEDCRGATARGSPRAARRCARSWAVSFGRRRAEHLQARFLTRTRLGVARLDVEYSIRVDTEAHFDLQVAARLRRQALEQQLTERLVLRVAPRLSPAGTRSVP